MDGDLDGSAGGWPGRLGAVAFPGGQHRGEPMRDIGTRQRGKQGGQGPSNGLGTLKVPEPQGPVVGACDPSRPVQRETGRVDGGEEVVDSKGTFAMRSGGGIHWLLPGRGQTIAKHHWSMAASGLPDFTIPARPKHPDLSGFVTNQELHGVVPRCGRARS